ncbi:MAG: hypothetical protein D3925_04375, partial [Candidatus Electrothrix sp. AR5]|nr:hypothetical protein [Candidatus Electrothrix sp. AR5]
AGPIGEDIQAVLIGHKERNSALVLQEIVELSCGIDLLQDCQYVSAEKRVVCTGPLPARWQVTGRRER